jgi:hypothetical protein
MMLDPSIEPDRPTALELPVYVYMVPAFMLGAALLPLPHEYYPLLRLVVCVAAGWVACSTGVRGTWGWAVLFGVVALVFNPAYPLSLPREAWAVLDVLTLLLFALKFLLNDESMVRGGVQSTLLVLLMLEVLFVPALAANLIVSEELGWYGLLIIWAAVFSSLATLGYPVYRSSQRESAKRYVRMFDRADRHSVDR